MKNRLETMMKIHTTQNLNSLSTNQSTSVSNTKNDRLKRAENSYLGSNGLASLPDTISFEGKGEAVEKIAKALREAKLVQKIESSKVAGKKSITEKILSSDFFDGLLDLMTHETFIQAAISFLICVFLRPLTIMSLPTKKSKEDNKYASAHSMSSGFVGLASSVLIAIPFSKGLKYAQNNMIANLKEETLKRMFPHLDLKSIVDSAGKRITDMKQWKDKFGNVFSKDMKNAMLIAKPIHATEIGEKTWEKFGIKLNKEANKGKAIAEWIDLDGKRVVEKLGLKDFCIAVEEAGMGSTLGKGYKNTNFFSLKYIGDDLLEAACKDLDIASTKGANGERLHPIHWKNKATGNAYTEIFDATHLSSYTETADSVPLFLSKVRTESGTGKTKYTALQSNVEYQTRVGVPEKIGSEIEQASLDADKVSDIQNKWVVWLPDIISRPLVATATIALLPKILKNVFHLEKPKKHQATPAVQQNQLEGENAKLALTSGKEVA
ncbi:MAG: hypothetical protein E7Z92_02460 [Cyanobacteria bacterium SIG31]|nr:hypothetical protein [Cyanobacteria bacterium SIG31]